MSIKFSWEIRPTNRGEDFGEELNGKFPLLVRRLLVQRGIFEPDELQKFLTPRLADLGCPFILSGMEEGVARIFQAVDRHETICIYGDYDVDGVSSVTLLHDVLSAYGINAHCFIPVRTKEGYGLSVEGIENALAACSTKPDLLITVDCGSSSVAEVALLNQRGIDVIIVDHHEAGCDGRPDAVALINAKMQPDSPLTYLCSAGVVFKLAHALLKRRRVEGFDLKQYLDVVAIATIADIVPLIDENRLLTRFGLRLMETGGNIGLRALNAMVGLKQRISASHVSFRLGPRLNAAGRMDAPLDALNLLLCRDESLAGGLAQRLDAHNKARQLEEEKIRNEALQMIKENFDEKNDSVFVLASRAWHPGVVGIVASYIMRQYYKPTFVISLDSNGHGKGSGRSIAGISLVKAIHACQDLLVKGGGHDMAAGLAIEEGNIDAFRAAFSNFVRTNSSEECRKPILNVDAEVGFEELTLDLLDSYELLEPFGNSNPQPVFMSCNVMLNSSPYRMKGNHIRLSLRQGTHVRDAMFFNGGNFDLPSPPWDIAFTIERNVWRGRSSLSISIQDIRSAE